ncbi:hypothetical protein AEGHOMDF_0693 [Methylobacterium soli]|nr:hypothetical protein AEGHOMDF_0693 [Methylobacterium soli]
MACTRSRVNWCITEARRASWSGGSRKMKGRCVSVMCSRIGFTTQSVNGFPVSGRLAGGRVSELIRGSEMRLATAAWVAAT